MQWAAFECWVTFVREKLLGHPQKKTLKVAVSRDLLTFFMKLTHLSPWETAKRVLLKDSFSRRYSEIDSAQAYTARSQKIKLAEIQNWLTLRGVRLCAGLHCMESNKYFRFLNVFISREFRIHMMIFRKKLEYFSKIQNWLTLRRVNNLIFRRSKTD